MRHRGHREWRRGHEDLNRGDYRGDFGPEGYGRFVHPTERHSHRHRHPGYEHTHEHEHDHGHQHNHEHGDHNHEHHQQEGWRRGRVGGGYGSQFDAWRSGAGYPPAGFGFGPEEDPRRGGFEDQDWQVTRPARGRSRWAGDWSDENYRGRGPKDYRRSDERIREEVCERLTDDWSVDASEISVEVRDGEVTLTGSVPSREHRRRAEECVERVHGVQDVFNRLHVERDADVERSPWRMGAR